jgi:RNA polymerase sigma-70 factor (ECF subfamily)
MRFFRSQRVSALPDAQLVDRYRATHDKDLVGILFDRHAHLVFGICFKLLKDEERARDAVLTVFENLFEDLLRFEVRNFSAWMHTVARNYCLAELNRVRREACDRLVADVPGHEAEPADPWLARRLGNLKNALAAINEEQKTCIELFYLHQLSYREVAARTGMTYNQVKSHIQNGKRNLKKILAHVT